MNAFGVTEATIDSSRYENPPSDLPEAQMVPIGRAFPGTQLYVLDAGLSLTPVGVWGESAWAALELLAAIGNVRA